jgi:hypothetical protein
MRRAQMRTIPHLPQVMFGMLALGGVLVVGLVWSMLR